MDSLRKEYEELEKYVVELATKFNDAVGETNPSGTTSQKEQPTEASTMRKPRRKRGTELTLDD